MRKNSLLDVRQPFPEEKMKHRRTKSGSHPSLEMMAQKPDLEPIAEKERNGQGKIRVEESFQLKDTIPPPPDEPIH